MRTTNLTMPTASHAERMPYILRVAAKRGVALPDLPSAARAFVEADMVGRGSSFYTRGKGDILDATTGAVVARVSPNGRVWAGAKYVPGATPIAERWERRECECHHWTGDEPHNAPGRWLADCGLGGTYLCCDETKAECERQAAADPSIDPATFTAAADEPAARS